MARKTIERFTTVLFLLLLSFPTAAQQTNKEVMYFAQGKTIPPGLTDLPSFGLFRKAARSGRPVYTGWVMSDRSDPDGSTTAMKAIRVKGPRLSFTTTTAKGLLLTFDGRFIHSGDLRRYFNKDVTVIEGIVRKYRKGRKIAEGTVRFRGGIGG